MIDAVECLQDVVSHYGALRSALECKKASFPETNDGGDERSYWQHEINVLSRMREQAANAIRAMPRDYRKELAEAMGMADGVRTGLAWSLLIGYVQDWRRSITDMEAQRNPIPTLIQEYEKDGKELDGFQQAIVDYATEIGNVRDQAAKLQSYLTPSDREKFESDIALMEKDLQLQEQDLDEFKTQHEAFRVEIQRADAIWKLNMAVSKANAKNRGVRAEETIARIKKDTALDAVSSAMNRSKAQLRQRIRDRTVVQLTDQSSPSMGGYEKLFGDADKGDRQAARSTVFAMPYGKDKQ